MHRRTGDEAAVMLRRLGADAPDSADEEVPCVKTAWTHTR